MPDDGSAETSVDFPDPVSRSFAFDDAFFELNGDDSGHSAPAAPEEEIELTYDPGSADPAPQEGADPFADLVDSINAELSHMETAGSVPKAAQPQAAEPPQPPRSKNTVTYDEFRARFTSPEPLEEPAAKPEPDAADFALHGELELGDEGDLMEEDLLSEQEETGETFVSAADLNIRLDTEEEEENELLQQPSVPAEDEADGVGLDLRETAISQPAAHFDEGEEPPELTAPYSPPKGNFFTRNLIPVKGDSAPEIIRKIIMIVAVLAAIGSAAYLFNDYVITPYRTANQIDQLSEMIDEENTDVIEADDNTLQKEYPGVTFPEGMMEKYASLYARNPDFVGWLSIDALDISLPVVQGENNEQYLKTDFDGKKNKYGSLFVNSYNNMKSLDMNTTIFGHNMKDSKMLGNLVYYRTPKGYLKAPLIEFNTLYHNYKWKIFAVMLTNGEKEQDNGYLFNYMFANLSSEEVLDSYLGEIKQRSLYYPEVDIALSDKFLTISTCVYDFDEARLIILARMVRPGESTAVSGRVFGNENPRYPQAYYDNLKLVNPYADEELWYPE